MLKHTFLHLPRISTGTEQKLWNAGITTWTEFLRRDEAPGMSDRTKIKLNTLVHVAKKQLNEENATYFTQLPTNEHWRCYEDFGERACYVDIETNYRNDITVLGISDGEHVWQFVRHHNLAKEPIQQLLKQFSSIVTFNGACFDLPILKNYFGSDIIPDIPHIDLRFSAARIGLTGGLKNIEQTLGVHRTEDTQGMSGADALTLWAKYRSTQDETHLRILLEYNAEDIVNLKPLAQYITSELKKQTYSF